MSGINMTAVRLLAVPLGSDYKHTLHFDNKDDQYSYFSGKVISDSAVFSDFSYIRKDNKIAWPQHIDQIRKCNYIMYKNAHYSSKWFYAFITDLEYVNDGRTDIHIETDVIQTWYFDYKVEPSFIEREHTDDDTIGVNTYPEQLETGDYIINSKNMCNGLLNIGYMVATTIDLHKEGYPRAKGEEIDGVFSGVKYFYGGSIPDLENIITECVDDGKADAIVSIFAVPSSRIGLKVPQNTVNGFPAATSKSGTPDAYKTDWAWVGLQDDKENYKPDHIDGYKPKNNKLFTYPYSYMLMSNNSGSTAVYKYELFNDPDDSDHCPFWIYSTLTPGMSIRIVPRNYNGVGVNYDEGLNLGKFPICAWTSDLYTNWLTQNGINIGLSVVSGAFQIAAGLGMLGSGAGALAGAGSIASGAMSIAGTVGEVYQHSLQPPQAEGNINSGDVTFGNSNLTFTAYHMSIKKEYARIIDNYFDMFGYKCCRVKIPNKNHRECYWYTKTIDVNITGAIPQADLQKIKDCYNNGITFWKYGNIVGNYSAPNGII